MGESDDAIRVRRKLSFDAVAELYEAARPAYPEALYERLEASSQIPAGGRILEVGSGTGKATLPLAQRGYQVLCLELGENLAAVARRRLAAFPAVEIQVTAFEDWAPEEDAFDLVTAAQVYHWLDPDQAWPVFARALRPGGAVGLFWNMPAEPTEFDQASDAVYAAFNASVQQPLHRILPEETIARRTAELKARAEVQDVEVHRFPWVETYTSARYRALLGTYSDNNVLSDDDRQRLVDALVALVDERGGRVEKPYQAVLFLARTTPT
jgi:SAM-dependent methyltransferase